MKLCISHHLPQKQYCVSNCNEQNVHSRTKLIEYLINSEKLFFFFHAINIFSLKLLCFAYPLSGQTMISENSSCEPLPAAETAGRQAQRSFVDPVAETPGSSVTILKIIVKASLASSNRSFPTSF